MAQGNFGSSAMMMSTTLLKKRILKRCTSASYSDDLMNAFKRKTQELCDETREQYERAEDRAQHERQLQSLQRQLREVVCSSVSLAEHEQILATTTKKQQRQLEGIRRQHQSEMHELKQRCEHKWEGRVAVLRKQNAQDKYALLQRIEQLGLQKSEAAAEAKERELSALRWGEKLEALGREKQVVEKRVEDVKKRLEDACRIIVALKTRVRYHAKLAHALESQRDKTTEMRDEVMRCKVAYAELKSDMTSLEKELAHAQLAKADDKVNTCSLQSQVVDLRDQLQRQQCAPVELRARGALSAENQAAERKQLHKEVETLQKALQQEKQAVNNSLQRATETQLLHQTLVLDLRTRMELQQTTEASLKRQTQRLKQCVRKFKAVAEKLHAENKQLGEQLHGRDASTEAWTKKLFGRQ